MKSELILTDCLKYMAENDFKVDYIISGPADLSEIGLDPRTPGHIDEYKSFLKKSIIMMADKSDLITLIFTDRKYHGKVLSKSQFIMNLFQYQLKWNLNFHKIWVKSFKINLYRHSWTNCLTFSKNKMKKEETGGDILLDTYKIPDSGYDEYKHGFPEKIIEIHINALTKESDIVFDPFMGSGTVAMAALKNNRRYLGCEILESTYQLSLKRIKQYNNINTFF